MAPFYGGWPTAVNLYPNIMAACLDTKVGFSFQIKITSSHKSIKFIVHHKDLLSTGANLQSVVLWTDASTFPHLQSQVHCWMMWRNCRSSSCRGRSLSCRRGQFWCELSCRQPDLDLLALPLLLLLLFSLSGRGKVKRDLVISHCYHIRVKSVEWVLYMITEKVRRIQRNVSGWYWE